MSLPIFSLILRIISTIQCVCTTSSCSVFNCHSLVIIQPNFQIHPLTICKHFCKYGCLHLQFFMPSHLNMQNLGFVCEFVQPNLVNLPSVQSQLEKNWMHVFRGLFKIPLIKWPIMGQIQSPLNLEEGVSIDSSGLWLSSQQYSVLVKIALQQSWPS